MSACVVFCGYYVAFSYTRIVMAKTGIARGSIHSAVELSRNFVFVLAVVLSVFNVIFKAHYGPQFRVLLLFFPFAYCFICMSLRPTS